MPYCPRCDMEFIDGITACSDCHGPLAESEEAYRKELMQQELSAIIAAAEQPREESKTLTISRKELEQAAVPAPVYVKKSQKYEDVKSSACAFALVGAILVAFASMVWLDVLALPMTGPTRMIFQILLTAMGAVSLWIAIYSAKSAKSLILQAKEEEQKTAEIIETFLQTHSAHDIDSRLSSIAEAGPEELSLKRFEIIQDLLVTQNDLPDPGFVEILCEDIYGKLYE